MLSDFNGSSVSISIRMGPQALMRDFFNTIHQVRTSERRHFHRLDKRKHRYHILIAIKGRGIGQLLVRGLDDWVINSLKQRAARNGRSVEAEHRAILELVLEPEAELFAELAARLRATTPPSMINSTELIRADRDRNYNYDPDEP